MASPGAALREEDGPEVLKKPFQAPHFGCGEGKVQKQPEGDKTLILPVQQDRIFNKPCQLWKRVEASVGSTEAEAALAAALVVAAAAAAAAPALLGETVPLRQGRTRLELKEAPARRRRRALPGCSVKALRQKKIISNL